MDYQALLKKAFEIVWKNKFLWFFGFLAGGVGGGFNFPSSSFNSGGSTNPSQMNGQMSTQVQAFNKFLSDNLSWIIGLAIFFVILGLVFFVLSIISRGALYGTIKKIVKGEKTGIKDGFLIGWHKFWRILGISVLLFLIIFLPIMFFVGLAILLAIYKIWFVFGFVIFLGIVGIIVLGVLISLIVNFIYCYAVLGDKKAVLSIKSAYALFKLNWKSVGLTYLVMIAVNIVAGIALMMVVLAVGLPLFLLGLSLYATLNLSAVIAYAVVVGLLMMIFLMALGGAIGAFNASVWTLVYLKLEEGIEIK